MSNGTRRSGRLTPQRGNVQHCKCVTNRRLCHKLIQPGSTVVRVINIIKVYRDKFGKIPYTFVSYRGGNACIYLTSTGFRDVAKSYSREITTYELARLQSWVKENIVSNHQKRYENFKDDMYVQLSNAHPVSIHFKRRCGDDIMFPYIPTSFVLEM